MKHYLTTCPIMDFKIASECENMLLGTTEKKERWKNITNQLKFTNARKNNYHRRIAMVTKIQISK